MACSGEPKILGMGLLACKPPLLASKYFKKENMKTPELLMTGRQSLTFESRQRTNDLKSGKPWQGMSVDIFRWGMVYR